MAVAGIAYTVYSLFQGYDAYWMYTNVDSILWSDEFWDGVVGFLTIQLLVLNGLGL